VEAHSTAAFAAEENTTAEGLPQHMGHPSPTPYVSAVEAAVAPLAAAKDAPETTGQGTPRHPE